MASASGFAVPATARAVAKLRRGSCDRPPETPEATSRAALRIENVSTDLAERGAGKTRPARGWRTSACRLCRMVSAVGGRCTRCGSPFFVMAPGMVQTAPARSRCDQSSRAASRRRQRMAMRNRARPLAAGGSMSAARQSRARSPMPTTCVRAEMPRRRRVLGNAAHGLVTTRSSSWHQSKKRESDPNPARALAGWSARAPRMLRFAAPVISATGVSAASIMRITSRTCAPLGRCRCRCRCLVLGIGGVDDRSVEPGIRNQRIPRSSPCAFTTRPPEKPMSAAPPARIACRSRLARPGMGRTRASRPVGNGDGSGDGVSICPESPTGRRVSCLRQGQMRGGDRCRRRRTAQAGRRQ